MPFILILLLAVYSAASCKVQPPLTVHRLLPDGKREGKSRVEPERGTWWGGVKKILKDRGGCALRVCGVRVCRVRW